MGVPPPPVIDLSNGPAPIASAIDAACRDTGFFYVVGHGVDSRLGARLDALAREFFALDAREKAQISMDRGGQAWRGWFPVGGELTSGAPDDKEGIYFGTEAPGDGRPLHGANLWPVRPAGMRAVVLEYMDALTSVGRVVARGMALGLGLDEVWFEDHITASPTVLFRIFHYPPSSRWGVGEHTDYGFLTLLLQDAVGGLEVRGRDGWTSVPPIPDSFVCNLGDMLERITRGRYRSTPHRVRNPSGAGRLSLPFFYDPSWDADVRPIPTLAPSVGGGPRWDGADPADFEGTYGEYLVAKVAKVFPALGEKLGG